MSGRNSPNPAILLVPWAGGLLRSCPLTRAELLCDEHLYSHLSTWIQTKATTVKASFIISMRWQKNSEKENIGAISNEENQQYVDVFTMTNVQNYISFQANERKSQLQRTECDLNVSKRFFCNISENREISSKEKKSWLISVRFYLFREFTRPVTLQL